MIDKALAESVLAQALSSGGDFAELYIEDGTSNVLTMTDGKVEDAVHRRSCGAGVRVFSGLRSVYAYTTGYAPEDLARTARACAAAISGEGEGKIQVFSEKDYSAAPRIPYSSVANARRIEKLRAGHAAAKSQ